MIQQRKWKTYGSLIAALVAGVMASSCCLMPLILLLLGISSTCLNLKALEPFRPIAVLVTLSFLGFVFWRLYLKPATCEAEKVCVSKASLRSQRILFWIMAVILLLLLALPWYANWFIRSI